MNRFTVQSKEICRLEVEIMTVPVEYRTIETEVRLPYRLALGATWTRFFEGLKRKIIYGSRCPKCNRVLVPARSFCPRCFVNIDEWLEVPQEGTLEAWVSGELSLLRHAHRATVQFQGSYVLTEQIRTSYTSSMVFPPTISTLFRLPLETARE